MIQTLPSGVYESIVLYNPTVSKKRFIFLVGISFIKPFWKFMYYLDIIITMKKVTLGKTGIKVSRLGMGTGTAHPSGYCAQALMNEKELAELLLYAFELGINFLDTAFQYGTYSHIREALKHINRSDVVITTKLITSNKKDTIRDFDTSLRKLSEDKFCRTLYGFKQSDFV